MEFYPITIPEKYWLKTEYFNWKQFDVDDINIIYNSPFSVIYDFEKINGFIEHVNKLNKLNELNQCKKYVNINKKNII